MRLAQLARYESVAERLDVMLHADPREVPANILFWHDRLATEYRRLLGVEFTERNALRRELMTIIEPNG